MKHSKISFAWSDSEIKKHAEAGNLLSFDMIQDHKSLILNAEFDLFNEKATIHANQNKLTKQ